MVVALVAIVICTAIASLVVGMIIVTVAPMAIGLCMCTVAVFAASVVNAGCQMIVPVKQHLLCYCDRHRCFYCDVGYDLH